MIIKQRIQHGSYDSYKLAAENLKEDQLLHELIKALREREDELIVLLNKLNYE